jgi:aquaporin Z
MLLVDVVTEFVGTFVLIAVIVATSGQAIAAGIALAGAIFLVGAGNPAHFNPAVSVAMFLRGKVTPGRCAAIVASQVAAAGVAIAFVNWMRIKPTTH